MIKPGTYRLGPDNAELLVRTGRAGAAARVGHDLVIEVQRWDATLMITDEPSQSTIELTADGGSLTVREGTGGMKALGDDDKRAIRETIDSTILRRTPISFHSTSIEPTGDGSRLAVQGELELLGRRLPVTFQLRADDDRTVSARAVLTQTDFGIKPYSAMLGALKVANEVEVTFAGTAGV